MIALVGTFYIVFVAAIVLAVRYMWNVGAPQRAPAPLLKSDFSTKSFRAFTACPVCATMSYHKTEAGSGFAIRTCDSCSHEWYQF